MTRRHARYLREYPERIARKRLKRRRANRDWRIAKLIKDKKIRTHLQNVLRDYVASRPSPEPIRAGEKKWHEPVTKFFRKPMI